MKNIKNIKGKLGTVFGILFVSFVIYFLIMLCMIHVKETQTHTLDIEYTMENGVNNRELFFLVYHPSQKPKHIVTLSSDTLRIGKKYMILNVKEFSVKKHKIEN